MGAAASSPRRTLPRSFRKIRLELAREKGRPAGSASSGYIIVAPLDQDHSVDEMRDLQALEHLRPLFHVVPRRLAF